MLNPAHIEIKGNEEADKAEKQAIDMPGMTTSRLPYTDYYLIIIRARNSEWQREWENSTSKLQYIKPYIEEWESAYNSCWQYEMKLSTIQIGHTRLTHEHLMARNKPPPTYRNTVCGNQRLTIKNCLQDCPKWRDSRKNIQYPG